jgi:tripeptide aminopeptidase
LIQTDRLVKTFCELVAIDSPSGLEEAVTLELEKRFLALGFHPSRDSHGNLIATEDGEKPLMLSAHMDTVDPGRGIIPIVDGDTIRSDGTTILGGDCKAGITAILEALESIKESGRKRHPVQLVFTKGEEIGLVGARNLDLSLIKADRAFVFDGNGPVSKITTASPTYISLEVHITGRSAHAGVEPEKGLSAIKIATEIISLLPQGRIDEETTINVGTISGGSVRNAVPEEARFSGEFRSRNTETLDLLKLQVLDAINLAKDKYQDAIISEELTVEFQMYTLGENDPMVEEACRILRILDLEPEMGPSGGGTDANIFNRAGIRCAVVGMATRDMHTVREHVFIPDLVDAARFCEELLLRSSD